MQSPYEWHRAGVQPALLPNSLARHIAMSCDPKIRRIFDQWRDTPALDSPLVKNQELKQVLVEETPWLVQANKETEARHNVGVLFDDNRAEIDEARSAIEVRRSPDDQLGDGFVALVPVRPAQRLLHDALHDTTGYGKLRHLGVSKWMLLRR